MQSRFAALAILLAGAGLFASAAGAISQRTRNQLLPLRVSSSGRYFETSDGRPWFWLGDTAWPLLVTYTRPEAETYLAARAQMGFTVVQMVAVWDGGTGTENGTIPNPNTAGVAPWQNHDPLRPNEAYWKNVDAVIAAARKDGLYVGLLPAWGSFVVNSKMITMANAEAYGRWLGSRYRTVPNIVWIVGGDRRASDAPDVFDALARGLRQGDGGVHPITFHPGGEGRNPSGIFQARPWLAADMIQTWAYYTDIPIAVGIDYGRSPVKPVIVGEGAYEDGPEYPTRPITPLIVRKQAYWTYLSGGFFTYGHNDMWRKNPTWKASLFSEGAKDMQVLHGIFGALPWWNLKPDAQMFASGRGWGATLNVAAISSDRTWAMVYFSSAATSDLRLDELKPGDLTATWIDPKTGRHSVAMRCSTMERAEKFTTPGGWPDAVLLLQRSM